MEQEPLEAYLTRLPATGRDYARIESNIRAIQPIKFTAGDRTGAATGVLEVMQRQYAESPARIMPDRER